MVCQIDNGKGLGLEPWRALTESLVRLRVFRPRLGLNELANLAQKEGNVLNSNARRQSAKKAIQLAKRLCRIGGGKRETIQAI